MSEVKPKRTYHQQSNIPTTWRAEHYVSNQESITDKTLPTNEKNSVSQQNCMSASGDKRGGKVRVERNLRWMVGRKDGDRPVGENWDGGTGMEVSFIFLIF